MRPTRLTSAFHDFTLCVLHGVQPYFTYGYASNLARLATIKVKLQLFHLNMQDACGSDIDIQVLNDFSQLV